MTERLARFDLTTTRENRIASLSTFNLPYDGSEVTCPTMAEVTCPTRAVR